MLQQHTAWSVLPTVVALAWAEPPMDLLHLFLVPQPACGHDPWGV
jgi:hypothetical protein